MLNVEVGGLYLLLLDDQKRVKELWHALGTHWARARLPANLNMLWHLDFELQVASKTFTNLPERPEP